MAKNKDWMPKTRHEKINMASAWLFVITTRAKPDATPPASEENLYTGSKAEAWNIPAATMSGLGIAVQRANETLAAISDKGTRTEVATAIATAAFNELTALMRDMKRRYFYAPPLAEADIISLGLRMPDTTPTPTATPTAEVTIETFLKGRHQLGINLSYLTGSPTDPANKGYRVWYRVVANDEPKPSTPDDLHKSFFTRKRKEMINFDYTDSGKTAWMAVQIENNSKKGPWGPLVSALIP
jgi:hypothetical protein